MAEPETVKRDHRQEIRVAFTEGKSAVLANNISKFYLSLLTDWTWVSRRVETIKLIGLDRRERQVSVDITVSEVRRRAQSFGLADYPELPVPIALLPKGLFLDFDVRDSAGGSVSVFNREQDSRLAQRAMTTTLAAQPALGYSKLTADDKADLSRLLYEIAHRFPDEDDEQNLVDYGEPFEPPSFAAASSAARRTWNTMFAFDPLSGLVRDFAMNFAPIIWFPLDGSLEIVKYRRVEHVPEPKFRAISGDKSSLPEPSYPLSIHIPDVGRAAREHIRVVAPEGTFFGSSFLMPVRGALRVSFLERLTRDRSVLYTTGLRPGDYYMLGLLYAELPGFFTPAALLAATTSAILLLGGGLQLAPLHIIERFQAQTDAAVTILVLIPTIFVAFLIRDNEHPIRRLLLRKARVSTLLLTILPLVVAVISLFVNFNGFAWWFGLGWIALGIIPVGVIIGLLTGRRALSSLRTRISEGSAMAHERSLTIER
jgi:hypothetical protein